MDAQARDRAIGLLAAIEDTCAEQIVGCAGGRAILDSRHPLLFSANMVRAQDRTPVHADGLLAAAEEYLGALPFRMICAFDEPVGQALVQPLAASGYEPCHDLLMIFDGAAKPAPLATPTDAVPCKQLAPSRIAAAVELLGDVAIGCQLVSRDRLIAETVSVRCFAVLDQGAIAARCQLYTDGDIAQIENVYTHPAHRRGGLARALATRACQEALADGAELVFLIADADGWPQRLYREIGFRDAGLLYRFRR